MQRGEEGEESEEQGRRARGCYLRQNSPSSAVGSNDGGCLRVVVAEIDGVYFRGRAEF